jgi:hypothetical protein
VSSPGSPISPAEAARLCPGPVHQKASAVVVTRDAPLGAVELIKNTLLGFRRAVFFEGAGFELVEASGSFSKQPTNGDMKVFGRYGAACDILRRHREEHPIIYVQDDDCITDPAEICRHYQPGVVVCNMPQQFRLPDNNRGYAENSVLGQVFWNGKAGASAMVGFGAVFDASLIEPAFDAYFSGGHPRDEIFLIECDRIFTAFNWTRFVDVKVTYLPHGVAPGRISMQSDHESRYREIRRRIMEVWL